MANIFVNVIGQIERENELVIGLKDLGFGYCNMSSGKVLPDLDLFLSNELDGDPEGIILNREKVYDLEYLEDVKNRYKDWALYPVVTAMTLEEIDTLLEILGGPEHVGGLVYTPSTGNVADTRLRMILDLASEFVPIPVYYWDRSGKKEVVISAVSMGVDTIVNVGADYGLMSVKELSELGRQYHTVKAAIDCGCVFSNGEKAFRASIGAGYERNSQ